MWSVDDIDFGTLTPQRFEELCHDLIHANGFRKLSWRQGGADRGRDIEAYWLNSNGIVEDYEEKWFFECKRFNLGVPPEELYSKIAWAEAEKPRHLVFFVSSYLTTGTRHWIEQIRQAKIFEIHVVEGKRIKTLLAQNSKLFHRYFPSKRKILLLDSIREWEEDSKNPAPTTLARFLRSSTSDEFDIKENAFIFVKSRPSSYLIDAWLTSDDLLDYSLAFLKQNQNSETSILDGIDNLETITTQHSRSIEGLEYVSADIKYGVSLEKEASYIIYFDNEGGIEILLTKKKPNMFWFDVSDFRTERKLRQLTNALHPKPILHVRRREPGNVGCAVNLRPSAPASRF